MGNCLICGGSVKDFKPKIKEIIKNNKIKIKERFGSPESSPERQQMLNDEEFKQIPNNDMIDISVSKPQPKPDFSPSFVIYTDEELDEMDDFGLNSDYESDDDLEFDSVAM